MTQREQRHLNNYKSYNIIQNIKTHEGAANLGTIIYKNIIGILSKNQHDGR